MALTRRQKQVYDYVCEFIEKKGYSPSLEEIGRRFGLTSVATVHKHVSHLVDKGLLRRAPNVNRSIEPATPPERHAGAETIPLLGSVAAGAPIEALEVGQTIPVPSSLIRKGAETFALRVRGNSMIDEQIRDGDIVVLERRSRAQNGEVVVALLDATGATLKTFYRDGNKVRLQPANPDVAPIILEDGDLRIQGIAVALIRSLRR